MPQAPISEYDAAIVGAGPAGSSLAIRLALNGLKVLLAEQKEFPREKLCGEFISPECLTHFAELGVLPEIDRSEGTSIDRTIFFGRSGRSVEIESEWFGASSSNALGLSRAAMDLALLDRARDLGVDVRPNVTVSGVIREGEAVTGILLRGSDATETSINAKVTIDATGRTRALARRVQTANIDKKAAEFVAFKTHLRDADLRPGACEIYAYRGGYGGCNRVEVGLFNLCFIATAADTKRLGSDAESVMREVVFGNLRAKAALENASVDKDWLAVPITRFGRGSLVPAPGMLTVGDAAAFIDPFTGSGILLALESAKIAAGAVANFIQDHHSLNSLSGEYHRAYSAAFDRRLRICSMLRYASSVPMLADGLIGMFRMSESLRRRVARSTR